MNVNANMDRGTHVSRCMNGVGMVGIVTDGGTSICGALDGVGAVVDRGMAHMWACAFTAADIASGFAHLPDCSPPV